MALVSLFAFALLGLGVPARAEAPRTTAAPAFTDYERSALSAGIRVSRPLRFTRGEEGYYVGGLSYQVVRATPREVMRALADVRTLPHALPHTLSAELLSSAGHSARIEFTQGKSPFVVTYTVHLDQTPSGDTIRFWLDPSRPHDVRDVWGFFRVQEFGPDRSLVTMAVALDLGPGLARLLFEDRVERSILRATMKIREFVEPRALAAAR